MEVPLTGPIDRARPVTAEAEEDTFVLLPRLDGGGHIAVFADGSYSRWMPRSAELN